MTNCIFYSLIFVLFLNYSVGSIKYSQINRCFMSLYKGVFESSLITIDDSGEPIKPYYNEELLETYLSDYFKENISKYVSNYKIKMYFLDETTGNFCLSGECRCVNITLTADINYFFKYEKSQNFSIKERI